MIKFKSCPRCQRGDMALDGDQFGCFLQCLQCAHILDLEKRSPTSAPRSKRVSKTIAQDSEIAIGMRQ